jgi:hypothetical protein
VPWRKLILVDAALLALIVLASRAAVVIHEVGGHALPAWAMGASTVEIRISPLGGGYVASEFPAGRQPSATGISILTLGGIALNLFTGIAAWFAARRLKRRGFGYAALLFFGFGSAAGAIVYLSNGFYYGSGDPTGFAPQSRNIGGAQWVWVLFVPIGAAAAGLVARHYLEFLSARAPVDTPARRLGWALATFGVAGLAYAGLWALLRDPAIESSTFEWRMEQEIAKETERRAAIVPPPVETATAPPPVRAKVRPEEVRHRVPRPVGPWVLYGISAIAALAALVTASALPPPR